MSIEVMYPSRHQPRSQNPLFAREFRRQRLGLMLLLAIIGFGLLLLQFAPLTAHADGRQAPQQPIVAEPIEPVRLQTQDGKPVRQIQIYQVHGISY